MTLIMKKKETLSIRLCKIYKNRNMETFLSLLSQGKISVNNLITHQFDFDDAFKAYEILTQNNKFHLGILLKYQNKIF